MFQLKHGAALIALCFAGAALAEDLPEFDGGDVVVTASGVPQARGVAPVSVSVITAQDIANSSARTVQEVMSQSSGVNVFNMGGANPSFDLHGFGITGISNTLVLVDGVRQSSNDLSAPDLSFIPLASIDRIEIVRGSGAVQYGSGATGGVINIITKAGYRAQNSAQITQTVGSFNLRQTDASFNLAGDRVSLDGYVQSMDTHHYRQNNAERRDGGGLGLNLKLDDGQVRIYARSSSDSLRLAGDRLVDPASATNEFDSNPTGTSTPNDYSFVKTDQVGLQGDQGFGVGRLYFQASTLSKRLDGWGGTAANHQVSSSDEGSLRYVLPLPAENKLTVGTDWLYGNATNAWSGGVPTSVKVRRQSLFAEAELGLWQGARVTVGGRSQRVDDLSKVAGVSYATQGELHAWQLGLRQRLGSNWSLFANQAQSFRLGKADEMSWSYGPLLPQLSHDQQMGIEWQLGLSSARANVFRSDLTNEIVYLPTPYLGYNVNLPKTRHEGIELEGRTRLAQTVGLHGSLTWQKSKFMEGVYNGTSLVGKQIPMVPQWMANAGVSWDVRESTSLSLDAQYVGTQYMDNDWGNQYTSKLSAYTVVNTKLTQQFTRQLSGSFSVNNLLNRHYANYGVTSWKGSGTGYAVYPADPRNFQASLTLKF
ncbi:TonB-dependent receptor [Paludibacterium purpuratum]|uniref:Iron complex outermembrane receptor protein n=1 Tax=Paludibacterium purpuratum TaxID=1144873 RepID=A0A4R7B6Z6_9NEIS|nr:TonB-dependent receptor [Paludibacterium purpuratum]TDR80514.1 iron complex outermembrane receptor protein [Paludibacterium purpuratum]